MRSKTTRGAFAPRRRGYSVDLGRQHSLAHQASARLNVGGKAPPYSVAESPAWRQSARRLFAYPADSGPDNRFCRVRSRPWNKMVTWDRTPLGLETAAPCQPRAALASEGSERRWNSQIREFRRCTGRLNATQPGVLAVSPLYIRGLGPGCKGSLLRRRGAATLCLIRQNCVKL